MHTSSMYGGGEVSVRVRPSTLSQSHSEWRTAALLVRQIEFPRLGTGMENNSSPLKQSPTGDAEFVLHIIVLGHENAISDGVWTPPQRTIHATYDRPF